jgi:hydrogenase nickel incorporation protein HypB
MCVTCGCGGKGETTLSVESGEHVHADGTRVTHARGFIFAPGHAQGHMHAHDHDHGHVHDDVDTPGHEHMHAHDQVPAKVDLQGPEHSHHGQDLSVPGRDRRTVELEAQILGKNQLIAERNRDWLAGRGVLALNLLSSPGAGKTTLLERTLRDLKGQLRVAVIEGDQETSNDAERIRATGVRAVQINTGTGCHLEADMLERALGVLEPERNSLLMIENVGNLVCPALFDLGERAKVVIFSVTEGEDKPLKYPHMFSAATLVLVSKTDLLPHLRFDTRRAIDNVLSVNPRLKVLEVSAYSGEGMSQWYDWLKAELALYVAIA